MVLIFHPKVEIRQSVSAHLFGKVLFTTSSVQQRLPVHYTSTRTSTFTSIILIKGLQLFGKEHFLT